LIRPLLLGLVTVMLLVACDPIPHPDQTTRVSCDGSRVLLELTRVARSCCGPMARC
jgi:hypothetical protein